ncbi:MAG: CRISPR-associated endoribonuclease Cas6 [Candidatus Anstonellaceae archaeon]
MRLLLTLKSKKDAEYDLRYYNKVHGFIYNLLKNTPYHSLHNKPGYKFFCFSNIFPIGEIKVGDLRKFLISSPDIQFIHFLEEELNKKNEVFIGEWHFKIEEIKKIELKIPNKMKLVTATPLIIRIPKRKYSEYKINSTKPYLFWEPYFPFQSFIKQLEENLIKKYNQFYKTKIEEFPIFEQFEFKKTTKNYIVFRGKEEKIFGSIWEFIFISLKNNEKKKKLLKFAIDCGFGERNTYGFGFINIKK